MYANYSDLMDHSGTVIDNLYQAELHLRDVDRAERGYMITRDTMYIRFLNNSIDSLNADILDVAHLTNDNQLQIKNVALLKANIALRIAKARENINRFDTAKNFTLDTYHDSRKLMQECSKKLKEIHTIENQIREDRLKGEHAYLNLTAGTLKYLLIVFCIITLGLFIAVIRELSSRLKYQQELQSKVIDLSRSHGELQEIAYVASHDLQEPLRKIQVFSNMLLYQQTVNIDDESKAKLVRINNAANRMQSLIADLMSLTSLTKIDETNKVTDLNKIVSFIIADAGKTIESKAATVQVQQLPVINGYDNQLRLLFRALLDNALKFTRPGVKPMITITSEIITGHELSEINPNLSMKKFYRVTISDNGIGFDNQFINKIFGIFQRLHTQQSEYDGKGIGLAICQRIMANHDGYIMANGMLDMGAQFKLFFPVDK
jgi:signal transduction histidine kinase